MVPGPKWTLGVGWGQVGRVGGLWLGRSAGCHVMGTLPMILFGEKGRQVWPSPLFPMIPLKLLYPVQHASHFHGGWGNRLQCTSPGYRLSSDGGLTLATFSVPHLHYMSQPSDPFGAGPSGSGL